MAGNNNPYKVNYKNILGYPTTGFTPPQIRYGDTIATGSTGGTGTGSVAGGTEGSAGATGATGGGTSTPTTPTTYATILADLERQRQSAMTGAEAQYARAQASYGTTGDQLNRAGLGNSGYAAALDSAAYAAMARSKDAANAAYGQAVANAELDRQAKYEQILGLVNSGGYTTSQGIDIGKAYGLSDSQMASLNKVKQTKFGDIELEIKSDPSSYTLSQLDALATSGEYSSDEVVALKKAQNDGVYTSAQRVIQAGNTENIGKLITDVNALYTNGNIDEATYNAVQTLVETTPEGLAYQYDSGTLDAKGFVNKLKPNTKPFSITGYSLGKGAGGLGTRRYGDDVDVTMPNGKKFDLRLGEVVITTESGMNSNIFDNILGRSANEGDIIYYDGKLLIKVDKGWTQLVGDRDDEYAAVAEFLKARKASPTA